MLSIPIYLSSNSFTDGTFENYQQCCTEKHVFAFLLQGTKHQQPPVEQGRGCH